MTDKKKRSLWLILGVLCLLTAAVLIWYLFRHSSLTNPLLASENNEEKTESVLEALPIPSLVPPVKETIKPESTAEAAQSSTVTFSAEETLETEPYESPVDFEAIWAINPDVCAWLFIPGAEISLPVVQHPSDDTYYLTHDVQGQSSSSGAIFIEKQYNRSDFSDMCTVIYGHRMYSGEMFGTLQATYSDEETFAKSQDIVVYLPDREDVYQVFASLSYDNSHILYYNDFDDQLSYRKFINKIFAATGIGTTLDPELKPRYSEKLLILSTCLWGDKYSRYLVLAKEQSDDR